MFEISALWIQASWMQAFLKKYEIVPSGHNDGSRKRSLSRDCDAWAALHWRQPNAFYLMFRSEIKLEDTYYAKYWRQPNTLFLMFIFETSWKILIINIVDNKPCLNHFDQCLVVMYIVRGQSQIQNPLPLYSATWAPVEFQSSPSGIVWKTALGHLKWEFKSARASSWKNLQKMVTLSPLARNDDLILPISFSR